MAETKRETTVVIIKPDAYRRGIREPSFLEVLKGYYLRAGLEIVEEKPFRMSERFARQFYAEHEGKEHFDGLVLFMASERCLALLVQGENAIEKVREINGPNDSTKRRPGQIRFDYPSAGGPSNSVHGSDGLEAAKREEALIWPQPTSGR